MDHRLVTAWRTLRYGFGIVVLVAGLDKFTNLLADWPGYVSPFFASILPVSPQGFMVFVGVVETLVGLAILTKWPRIGAYVAMVWLLCIVINLLTYGRYFDVAARDFVLSLAAFALAKLTEVLAPAHITREERIARGRPATA